MKILIFTDTHGSLKALRSVIDKAKKSKPDLLICAGDISVFEQNLNVLLSSLNKLGIPTLIIHGNHETEETMEKAASLFKNINYIHKSDFLLNDILFLGYGGGGFSLKDKEFENFTKRFDKTLKSIKPKKLVLIVHAPPYNTKLDKINGQPCGNKSIRKFIDKLKPDLVIAGHLHENAGKEDKIGKTKLINPGPYGKVMSI